jgi:hypothetical protein
MSESETESESKTHNLKDHERVATEATRIEDQLAREGHTGMGLAGTIVGNLEDRSVTTDTLADAIHLHRKLAAQDHSLTDMASVLVDRIHRLAAGSTRTAQRRDQPTNYGDIRESFALALDAEAPEAKAAVLQTVDNAVANHSHRLHFPGDGPVEPVYSALIVHEDGSGIVGHRYDEQTLVIEYDDDTTTRYPFGSVEEINPGSDEPD